MSAFGDEAGAVRALQVMTCSRCGADVEITSPATVTVACEHCGTLLLRGDVEMESLGEVALAAPLISHFQLGTEGRFDDRPFTVRGQLQLDHGAGLWNEWAAETEGGWIWIAEAQGEILVFEEIELPSGALPARDQLPEVDSKTGDMMRGPGRGRSKGRWRPGDSVALGNDVWKIAEMGRGRVVACRGEFPIRIEVGVRTTYVDLSLGSGKVATLDYTRPGPPEFLSGRRVKLSSLALDASTLPDHRPDRVKSVSVKCNQCGGTIEVQDADRALTLGCAHCGSVLTRERQTDAYRAIEGEREMRHRPHISIGSRGTIRGEDVTVLGYLRRGVFDDGKLWPWHEYLLRNSDGAYRWLVESDGHWTYSAASSPGAIQSGGGKVKFGGNSYRHFSGGKAVVDTVLGEFYWQVKAGDTVRTDDYINTKTSTLVSLEDGPLAMAVSEAGHLPQEELGDVFPAAKLPKPKGVGIVQPNPVQMGSLWKTFGVLVLLLFASCVAVRVHHANEVVFTGQFGPSANASDTEKVEFSDTFEIAADKANLKVTLAVPSISQGYLALLGALVNEDTGEVITFTTAAQHYSGVSGGERWSEGKRRGSTLIGKVPRGRYRMRLATRPYDKGVDQIYTITAKSQVPRALWFVLGLLALTAFPAVQSMRAGAFEAKRWSNSDHAG